MPMLQRQCWIWDAHCWVSMTRHRVSLQLQQQKMRLPLPLSLPAVRLELAPEQARGALSQQHQGPAQCHRQQLRQQQPQRHRRLVACLLGMLLQRR